MKKGTDVKRWDIDRAAAEMGVSPHTVRAWLRQRKLPYLKLGRRVLLDPEDVRLFLERNRVAAVEV